MFVELAVKETTPNIKGAAVQNTSKPAILETGLEIKVPPYIEEGDKCVWTRAPVSSSSASSVPSQRSRTCLDGPRGRWLRCSSSTYLPDTTSSSRLASRHDRAPIHAHDLWDWTLGPRMSSRTARGTPPRAVRVPGPDSARPWPRA